MTIHQQGQTKIETTARVSERRDGGADFIWQDCELIAYKPRDEEVYASIYFHYDQDAVGHAFCSHSTRLWIV